MVKNFIKLTCVLVLAFLPWVSVVHAAVGYGDGYYVNLCGSGTVATAYTCDAGCAPTSGSCSSTNTGIVKWTCSGKWNQCFESESDWSNREDVGNPGCDKTVQISMFDKKCRKEDGTWDQSCDLLGYMVWYSGECGGVGIQPTPTQTSPTTRLTPTSKVTVTPKPTTKTTPTPTIASKFSITPRPTIKPKTTVTSAPVVKVCGKKCAEDRDCGAGFVCEGRVCRNPACPADGGCFCGSVSGVATGSGKGKSPETGAESWIVLLGVGGVIALGLKMKRLATDLW